MVRKVIEIDEEKCIGCGLCVTACHEGAIGMVDGKAKLMREDYCDGLGNCLPACPTDAISFVEREAPAFDAEAVRKNKEAEKKGDVSSQLKQWPIQIKLVSPKAPYFENANLLVAADCTAYAYGNFHQEFMKNQITIIGCPKLDDVDYTDKLTQILLLNDINSVTVVRMEVPCCGGIAHAVSAAIKNSGKRIPTQVVTISTEGKILDE